MRIDSFDRPKFKSFIKKSLKEITTKRSQVLILDIRNNLGGNIDHADFLLRYMIEKPINPHPDVKVKVSGPFKKQMKKKVPGFLRWLPVQNLDERGRKIWAAKEGDVISIQQPEPVTPIAAKKRFKGRVIVLVDGLTFSAASYFAETVQHYKLGTLIGKETGSRLGGAFAQAIPVLLRNTSMYIQIPTMIMKFNGIREFMSQGVRPSPLFVRDLKKEMKRIDSTYQQAYKLAESLLD